MAQATNLVFFIPTSIAAIVITIREKLINWKIAISITIAGVFGAIAGANISVRMDVNQLKKYFGIFLIIIAVYEIYSVIRKYILSKNKK